MKKICRQNIPAVFLKDPRPTDTTAEALPCRERNHNGQAPFDPFRRVDRQRSGSFARSIKQSHIFGKQCHQDFRDTTMKKPPKSKSDLGGFFYKNRLIRLYNCQNNPEYKRSEFPYHRIRKSDRKANRSDRSTDGELFPRRPSVRPNYRLSAGSFP